MKNYDAYRESFRCDLCFRTVDHDTRARARRAWQPLIVCDGCVRQADRQPAGVAVTA